MRKFIGAWPLIFYLIATSFQLCLPVYATEFAPWFSEIYDFQPQLISEYSHYNKVNCASGNVSYSDHDYFFDLSLAVTPEENWNAEFELQMAKSRARSFGIDSARLTGRYLWLDDVGGDDFISLATGLTLAAPLKQSIYDLSVFHHWYCDALAHVAIGKERSCGGPFWLDRAWLMVGIGSGTKGSPWLQGLLSLEKNFCDTHFFRMNGTYLRGLGKNDLISPFAFPGYASLAHRSFDLLFGYSYKIAWLGTASVDIFGRLYAKNCPQNVRSIALTLLVPFSL